MAARNTSRGAAAKSSRRLFGLAAMLAIASTSCGGRVAREPSTVGGSTSEDSAVPYDAPAVDSGACQHSEAECVLCDDAQWHCGPQAFPTCSPDASPGGPCTAPCVACMSDGAGLRMLCPGSTFEVVSFACSP